MAAVVVISVVRALAFFEATFHAATRMNLEMSARVLRAPLAFFHTNPAGRVLNRFSKDQGAADDLLPQARNGPSHRFCVMLMRVWGLWRRQRPGRCRRGRAKL